VLKTQRSPPRRKGGHGGIKTAEDAAQRGSRFDAAPQSGGVRVRGSEDKPDGFAPGLSSDPLALTPGPALPAGRVGSPPCPQCPLWWRFGAQRPQRLSYYFAEHGVGFQPLASACFLN
jgi:hypothetical protein